MEAGGRQRQGGRHRRVADRQDYLLDMNYAVLDSLYWNNGLITHTFAAPGAYRFCSGGCWDPPEFGIIYSH